MRTTIDRAGRIVIPSALREHAGLRPGPVEVVADGSGVRIETLADEAVEERDGRLVIPASDERIDDRAVRTLRDADQR